MSEEEKKEKENKKIYEQKRYFALALDPIHVGTGGYRIGRVDNTIVREPATGIPKIPGTTIEGVCRSYAYLKIMENDTLREELKKLGFNQQCAKGKIKKDEKEKLEPCGICPICITFGYTKESEKEIEIKENSKTKKKRIAQSLQAMALFSDARILFFPVATMIGPVWITCPMVLKDAEIKEINNGSEKEILEPSDNTFIVPKNCKINPPEGKLNFGWLLLSQDNNNDEKTTDDKRTNIETNIDNWIYYENNKQKKLKNCKIPEEILSRVVIVPDDLFVTIVNSNLEVRTSIAIDPATGAVEEGALFTYEAIPRGTVFWFDVTYQNPKYFPALNGLKIKTEDGNEKEPDIDILKKTVKAGLSLFEYLGVGGMGSRGFGRMKVLNIGDKNDGK